MKRKWLLLLGGVLTAAGLGWWVVRVALLDPADRGDAAGYGQFVLAAIGLLISLVALWKTAAPTSQEPALDELTDRLMHAMRNQWTSAANERRLLQPAPLRIRWRRSDAPVVGPIAAATLARADHALFDPLPGLERVTDSRLRRGSRRDLHRVYGGLASGRLLIVGGPGTGKSSAAILLLLDALRYREQAPSADRCHIPVPVLFTLHNWNPSTTSVTTWLRTKLAEIPMFQGSEGARHAVSVLQAGRVAVFLDGLDEIPAPIRPLALQALSEQATFRLVLLTRTTELVDAARHHGLTGAAALQLEPLKPADVAEYLLRPLVEPPPPAWYRLAAALSDDPDSAVAQTLTIPLGVSLVRDAYPPDAPVDELCDTQRFPGAEDVVNHLLDKAVTSAYTHRPGQPEPRYTTRTAHHALTFVARRLDQNHTRDLTWWAIPSWVSRTKRVVLTALFGTVMAGLVGGAVFGLVNGSVADGLLAGLPSGLSLGLLAGLPRDRIPANAGPIRWSPWLALHSLRYGLVMGIAAGLLYIPVAGLAGALGIMLAVGIGTALVLYFTDVVSDVDFTSPIKVWRGDVTSGLRYGLTVGLALGVGLGAAMGPLVGLVWGIMLGAILGMTAPEASTTVVVQVYLAARHRVPLRLIRFLEDARSRHLLRVVGPVYQFRHAALQDRLVSRSEPPER